LAVRSSSLSEKVPRAPIWAIAELLKNAPDAIRLNIGEPDFNTPKYIVEAAEEALAKGYTHYMPDKGDPELRRAIAAKLERDNKFSVDPENGVIVTVGAAAANAAVLMGLLNEGDEVIMATPHYPNHGYQVTLARGTPVYVPAREADGYSVAARSIEEAVTSRTRAIIVLSPNNPTGAVYDRDTLEVIAEIARTKNLTIITDEVYEKFIYDDAVHTSVASIPGMEDRTIVTNSFSKTYAMTGWRIGYAAGNPEIIQRALKCHYAFNMSVAAFVQKAATTALTSPQDEVDEMIKEYAVRRRILAEKLGKIQGIHVTAPRGAFYVFPRISDFGISSMEFSETLARDEHVATVPGSAYGESGEGHIRISFAASRDKIIEGCRRIARFADRLGS